MTEPVVIWQDGDAWRDLAPDVRAVGAATVVSRRGSTPYVDVERGRQVRLPHPTVTGWTSTPCGCFSGTGS
jgi:hypothetical protein